MSRNVGDSRRDNESTNNSIDYGQVSSVLYLDVFLITTRSELGPRETLCFELCGMNARQLQQGFLRRLNRYREFRLVTAAELALENSSIWRAVFPEWQSAWPTALPSGPLPALMSNRLSTWLPAKGVLHLRNAFILGDHGWIFTSDGRCVADTNNYVADPTWMPPTYLPWLKSKARFLTGRTLSLLSNWGATNFFHMQIDVVPRVDFLSRAGWKWEDFDHILLPSFRSPTIDRQLALIGIPMEKVIFVKWGPLNFFQTEELVCTSYPGGRRTVLAPTIDYLRRVNKFAPSRGKRRLFVRRLARTRHLRNEAVLLPLLEKRGFEFIDPSSFPHVETAFHEAEFIVGPHGASLANLAFCRPGTRMLELVPSDQAYPFFYTMAVHGDLRYDCLIGKSDHETFHRPGETWNSPSDFTVDPLAFEQALDRLIS